MLGARRRTKPARGARVQHFFERARSQAAFSRLRHRGQGCAWHGDIVHKRRIGRRSKHSKQSKMSSGDGQVDTWRQERRLEHQKIHQPLVRQLARISEPADAACVRADDSIHASDA